MNFNDLMDMHEEEMDLTKTVILAAEIVISYRGGHMDSGKNPVPRQLILRIKDLERALDDLRRVQ